MPEDIMYSTVIQPPIKIKAASKSVYLENYEFAEMVTHCLLAHYMAIDSDVAIRKVAKKLGMRLTTTMIKGMCDNIRKSSSPFDALVKIITSIEIAYPVLTFIEVNYLCINSID